MKYKQLTLILLFILFIGVFPNTTYAANITTPEGIVFDDETGQITGYTGNDAVLIIPDMINGVPVTSIGDSAFYECQSLQSITLSNNITTIQLYAFASCKNLETVNLSSSLREIEAGAFSYCGKLEGIILPDSIDSIGEISFGFCNSLTSINIPEGLNSIDVFAFYSCNSLHEFVVDDLNPDYCTKDGVLFNKEMTKLVNYPCGIEDTSYEIPNGVLVVGEHAFDNCTNIKTVTFSSSVKTISRYAFRSCDNLKDVNMHEGVLSIEYDAFSSCSSITNIVLPDSVTSIGRYSFKGCQYMETIQLSKNLLSIGSEAFYGCGRLQSITIPATVTSVGYDAFKACDRLNEFIVEQGNTRFKSVDGVLMNISETTLIHYPPGSSRTEYYIPNGVTHIGSSAFEECRNLQYISIPDTVTHIEGDHAFFQCTSLKSITIPKNVESMAGYVFYWCDSLEEIHVEDGNASFQSIDGVLFDVTGRKLLQYPKGSTRVNYHVPSHVEELSIYSFFAFRGRRRLDNLYIPSSVTLIHTKTLGNYPELEDITIYGELGSAAEDYANSNGIDFIAGELVMVSGVELDKETLFMQPGEAVRLTATVYPQNALIKDIIWSTDNYNTASVSDGVVTARSKTGNATITATTKDGRFIDTCEVRVEPEQCTVYFNTVSNGTYSSFVRPAVVDFGSSVSKSPTPFKDNYSFVGWYPTPECDTDPIIFPFTPTEAKTFVYSKWESPDFFETCSDYEYWVKNGEATITKYNGSGGSVDIPSTLNGYQVTSIGSRVFKDNTKITHVTIPDGVTSIGIHAFAFCKSLESISIPNSVNIIGMMCFESCISLKSVVLPCDLTLIDFALFYNCYSLNSANIPDGVTAIEGPAFASSSLERVILPENLNYLGGSAFAQCTYLRRAYFKGDAPFVDSPSMGIGGVPCGVFDLCDSDFTVCYLPGATGFTNPWRDYPTRVYDNDTMLESSVYSINRTSRYLKGVALGTSASELKQGFINEGMKLKVFDAQGIEYNGSNVATGMTVKLFADSEVKDELTICVLGDINGDGKISITDYTLARLDILGLKSLAGVFNEASDINEDGKVSITDYTLIRLDILGLKNIH